MESSWNVSTEPGDKIVRKITSAHHHYRCSVYANCAISFSLPPEHSANIKNWINSLVACLSELRIKISMLSVSSAPHVAHRWRTKVISTCTINYIATFTLAWRLWTVHHRTLAQMAWCLSPSHRKYKMFHFMLFPFHSFSCSFPWAICWPENDRRDEKITTYLTNKAQQENFPVCLPELHYFWAFVRRFYLSLPRQHEH